MKVAEKGRYLVFLGCAIPYRSAAYEISARAVLRNLGVEMVEMPQFNCCGLPIDPIDHETMLIMASRNLSVAERHGLDILTLCPGCSGTLRKVNATLKVDGELRRKINGYLAEAGLEYRGEINVKHFIHVLSEDLGFEKIKDAVTMPLSMLRVAEHNGCHVLRPKEFSRFDDSEDPRKLRNLIEVTGAKCLDYIDETECCGAPSIGVDDKVPLQLARDKLNHVKAAGAQALITICPFCHMMYDTNQMRIEKAFNEEYGIPVLHYPQLLGLAMGLTPEELSFDELRVKASPLLDQIQKDG